MLVFSAFASARAEEPDRSYEEHKIKFAELYAPARVRVRYLPTANYSLTVTASPTPLEAAKIWEYETPREMSVLVRTVGLDYAAVFKLRYPAPTEQDLLVIVMQENRTVMQQDMRVLAGNVTLLVEFRLVEPPPDAEALMEMVLEAKYQRDLEWQARQDRWRQDQIMWMLGMFVFIIVGVVEGIYIILRRPKTMPVPVRRVVSRG